MNGDVVEHFLHARRVNRIHCEGRVHGTSHSRDVVANCCQNPAVAGVLTPHNFAHYAAVAVYWIGQLSQQFRNGSAQIDRHRQTVDEHRSGSARVTLENFKLHRLLIKITRFHHFEEARLMIDIRNHRRIANGDHLA